MHRAGAGLAGQERAGQGVQGGRVEVAGDQGGDGRVARIPAGGPGGQPAGLAVPGGLPGPPRALGAAAAGQIPQLVQGQVQLDVGGRPGPAGQPPGPGQPAAGLLQRVVVTLHRGPPILGPGLLAQRLQHRAQRRRARRRQIPLQPARAAERQAQPHPPAGDPVLIPAAIGTVTVGGRGAGPHLLSQPGQISQPGATGCGR